MNFLQRFLAQAREMWAGFSRTRRAMIIVAAIITLGMFIGIGFSTNWYGYSTEYVILPKSIPQDQLKKVFEKLSAENLSPIYNETGSEIRIPKSQFPRAVVTLNAEGFSIGSGKGFEIFEESSFGMTPFVQNVNYQRALQAELSRAISTIDSVSTARVLIARPDPTPFVRDQKPTQASVMLKFKPNAVFSRKAAASIVSLVSKSVDGLKPEDVVVVDSEGRTLSDPHINDKNDFPTSQFEYRRELETYLAGKAEEMLSQHLGIGRVAVRVSADINFQKQKEQRISYSPEEKVVLAERQTSTKSTAPSARGVAGATSNVSRGGGSSSGGNGESKEDVTQTDYAVSKTIREFEDKVGAVTRLTIAALTDLTPSEGTKPISREDVEKIIKTAIGFKQSRGDEIQVTDAKLGLPIPTIPEIDEETLKIQRLQSYVSLARNICLGLGVVTTAGLATMLLVRRSTKEEAALTPETELAEPGALDADLLNRFTTLAQTDPDRVATIMTILLNEQPMAA